MRNLLFLLLFIPVWSFGQTDTKVQDLTPATNPDADDIMYFEEDGVAKNISRSLFLKATIDSLQDILDTTIILRTDQNAKIALDEPDRLDFENLEFGVEDSDTVVIKDASGNVIKINITDLMYSVNKAISDRESEITALEDSIDQQRADMQVMELINDYDSIRINDAKDKFHLYVTEAAVQYRATLNIDLIDDPINPTVLSMTVEDADPDLIVITMSEYMMSADSSINRFSGAGGGNWSALDHAYPMDESIGVMEDVVGTHNGTITESPAGSLQGDSTGVASGAYYFDGTNDYVTITGKDHASDDVSMTMWVKPLDLGSDGNFIGGATGALFWGFQASTDGMRLGRVTDNLTTTTAITLTEGVWNHIAFAYDQTANEVTFWIDGVSEVETFSTTFTAATTAVGVRAVGVSGYFEGLMDDLFIWDVEITDNTVDSIYNSGPPGRRFDESGGDALIFQDSIKASFTISNADLGGTSYTVDSVFIASDVVELDLDNDITYGDIIRVSYRESTGYGIRDTAGNFAASVSLYQITNNVDSADAGNPVDYEIFENYDFQAEDLGTFTLIEQEALFNPIGTVWHSNYVDIVIDTIDEAATQVYRIMAPASESFGYELFHGMAADHDEMYISFNWKVSDNFQWTMGGKWPGIAGLPPLVKVGGQFPNPPKSGDGFWSMLHFKQGGYFQSYHRDATLGWTPWSFTRGDPEHKNDCHLNNGNWYNIVQRVKLNTFTGGVPNHDGVREVWVEGIKIYSSNAVEMIRDEGGTYSADQFNLSFFYGGLNNEQWWPDEIVYGYIDNINFYIPINDDYLGLNVEHPDSYIMPSPSDITDRDFGYDSIRTTTGSLSNSEYGSNYSGRLDETYLLDAGAGNTVTFTLTGGAIGGGDFLIAVDGPETNDEIISVIENDASLDNVITSSGRYLFLMWKTDYAGQTTGWTGTITHDDALVCGIGNSLVNGADEAFDLLGATTGYTMTNLAVAGHFVNNQLAAWNALSDADQQEFTHILVEIGLGDVINGNALETIKTDYQDMIDVIAGDINASCKIISYTLSPAKDNASMSAPEYAVWQAFNTWMSASLTSVYVVSTKNTVDLNDGSDALDAAYDSGDGLHVNSAGSAVILQNLKDEID